MYLLPCLTPNMNFSFLLLLVLNFCISFIFLGWGKEIGLGDVEQEKGLSLGSVKFSLVSIFCLRLIIVISFTLSTPFIRDYFAKLPMFTENYYEFDLLVCYLSSS